MTRREQHSRGHIDWEAAHRRLQSIDLGERTSVADKSRILAERAVRLAASAAADVATGTWLEVLRFERGARRYAIESRFVIEVAKCGRLSKVPSAQPLLIGITNLRSDLLPVFEPGFWGDAVHPDHPLLSHLVVLGEKIPDFGIFVDAVQEVSQVSMDELSEPRTVGALPHPEFVRGIAADGAVLLDGEALLRDRTVFVAGPSSSVALEREEKK